MRNPKKTESLIQIRGEVLVGHHSVRLALENPRRKINSIYAVQGSDKSVRIAEVAKRKGIMTKIVSRQVINQIADGTLHRGIVADAQTLPPLSLSDEEMMEYSQNSNASPTLLLCSIGDPYNLGSIIRTAYYLGIEQVFMCSPYDGTQASSTITAVVSRTSAGVVEIFPPRYVHNPKKFLETLFNENWDIIGAMPNPMKNDLTTNETNNSKKNRKMVLVVGNEGEGLSPSIVSRCTSFSTIKAGRSLHPNVDSLNVSVATALLIQSLMGS